MLYFRKGRKKEASKESLSLPPSSKKCAHAHKPLCTCLPLSLPLSILHFIIHHPANIRRHSQSIKHSVVVLVVVPLQLYFFPALGILPKEPFPAATGTFFTASTGEAFFAAGAAFFTATVGASLTVALFLAAGAALGAGALAPVEPPPRAGAERGPRTTGAAAFLTGATVATCRGWVL